MWSRGWRDAVWDELGDGRGWDVVIVGGGVTGAGVLREAVRRGLRAALVEARDFAWGASSRSSKFVHGGLRYLTQGQWGVTRECVRERDRLVREAPGLVERIPFTRAVLANERRRRLGYGVAFAAYDWLSGRRERAWHDAAAFTAREPLAAGAELIGGYHFADAQTDDARLVLRLLREAVRAGGRALNYAPVTSLLLARGGVTGVRVRDALTGREAEVRARVVVSATGAAADELRASAGAPPRMRPLRGSHLVFAAERLPVRRTLAFLHPRDGRNVCAGPWEGRTVVGTTDVDHDQPLDAEPRITGAELDYLMEAVRFFFAPLALEERDVVATWSGVRPVVGTRRRDSTRERRDSMITTERGLVTVTGGKLTTFRSTAVAVMDHIAARVPHVRPAPRDARAFDWVDRASVLHPALDFETHCRLIGRHGVDAEALVAAAHPGELAPLPGTSALAAELRWAARAEGVARLDDLLLRRTRLGVLHADGGAALLPDVRRIAQPELGWDDARWEAEQSGYLARWRAAYGVPGA